MGMDLKIIIIEEIDDFVWTKGNIEYPIDFLIGKKIYWRRTNLGDLEDAGYTMQELNKEDLKLGTIRRRDSWVLVKPIGKNVRIKI